MFNKKLALLSLVVVLVGCSSVTELSSAGRAIDIRDGKPAANCKFLGKIEGKQSTLLTGDNPPSVTLRYAMNDLRNKAAAMGGNVVYNATNATSSRWSDFAPLPSVMEGEVYHCAE